LISAVYLNQPLIFLAFQTLRTHKEVK